MNQFLYKLIPYSLREVSSLLYRMKEKIKDKYFWDKTETSLAEYCLNFIYSDMKKKKNLNQQIFGKQGTRTPLLPYRRGFNFKSFIFTTTSNNKKWIVKIGHRISPVVDFGDPSSKRYYTLYLRHRKLLQQELKRLPNLYYFLPEPQLLFWVNLDRDIAPSGITVILQPFMTIIPTARINRALTAWQKKQLLLELTSIIHLSEQLSHHHKLSFDLLGEGNLVIIKKNSQYHFTLLDDGLVNLNTPLPITKTVMNIAKMNRLQAFRKQLG